MNKDELENLYIAKKLSIQKISKVTNISVGKIFNLLKKYEIPIRNKKESYKLNPYKMSEEHKNKLIEINKKRKHTKEFKKYLEELKFKGGIGHKKIRKDGYISIYFPEHPKSNKDGYIMEHILVVEAILGRHLKDNEVVHHKNKVRDDNRKNNLVVMTFKEHAKLHMSERHDERRRLLLTQ